MTTSPQKFMSTLKANLQASSAAYSMNLRVLDSQTLISCLVLFFLMILLPTRRLPAQSVEETALQWQTFEQSLQLARQNDRLVFVDIYAPWCGWCLKMKKEVYTHPDIRSYLAKQFETTRLNFDDQETTHQYDGRELTSQQLAHTLKAETVPTVVILNAQGEYILHLSGFIEASKLLSVLRYIGSSAYKTQSYEAFLEAGKG